MNPTTLKEQREEKDIKKHWAGGSSKGVLEGNTG